MADSNYPSAVEAKELTQDDPFAELTQIMDQDLLSDRAAASVQSEREETDSLAHDSLALELESELMGDLDLQADEADAAAPEAQAAEPAPPSQDAAQTPDFDDLDSVFDDIFALGEGGERRDPVAEVAGETESEFAPSETLPAEEPFAGEPQAADAQSAPSLAEVLSRATFTAAEPFFRPASDGENEADPASAAREIQAAAPEPAPPAEDEPAMPLAGTFSSASSAEPPAASQSAWAEAPAPREDEYEARSEGGALGDWSPEAFLGGAAGAATHDEAAATPARRDADTGPPQVDTVDIPEETVPLADNLDVPEVSYEEKRAKDDFDEIEDLLSGAFGEADVTPETRQRPWTDTPSDTPSPAGPRSSGEDDTEREIEELLAAGIGAGVAAGAAAYARSGLQPAPAADAAGAFASDSWVPPSDELKPELAAAPPQPEEKRRIGTPVLVAAAVGCVVVLGGVAVFALSGGDGAGDAGPAVVRAEDSPVKVKPEDPGGTTIPNQDNQVYRRVAGETPETQPSQTRLVSSVEEPLDLPPAGEGSQDAGTAKIEDRLESTPVDDAEAEETAAVAARRVRTFVVRPNGAMQPYEPPVAAQAAADAADDAPQSGAATRTAAATANGNAEDADGGLPGVSVNPDAAVRQALAASGGQQSPAAETTRPADTEAVAEETAGQPAAGEEATDTAVAQVSIPRTGPIPPSRPAVVPAASRQTAAAAQAPARQTASTQLAAVQPSAESDWSVQISSQPSLQGAQQSYRELAERYGSLLQGRGVNIVKADIEGRGTFYRVRIPSSSKDEAIRLCERIKGAGGNCFVSR